LLCGNVTNNRQFKHFSLVSLDHTNNPGNQGQQENNQVERPAHKRNEAEKQAQNKEHTKSYG